MSSRSRLRKTPGDDGPLRGQRRLLLHDRGQGDELVEAHAAQPGARDHVGRARPLPEALDHPPEDLLHAHALGDLVGVGEEVPLERIGLDPEAPGHVRAGGGADDVRRRRDALGLDLPGEVPDREALGQDQEVRLDAARLEKLQDGQERSALGHLVLPGLERAGRSPEEGQADEDRLAADHSLLGQLAGDAEDPAGGGDLHRPGPLLERRGRPHRPRHPDRGQRREHEAAHGRSSPNEVRPGGSIRGRRRSLARHEAYPRVGAGPDRPENPFDSRGSPDPCQFPVGWARGTSPRTMPPL